MAKVRAVPALVVLGLFPVAVVGLLGAVVALAVLAFRNEMVGAGVQVLFWLGLVLVIGLVAALRSAWKGRPQPITGVRLDEHEHEHPRLWQEVRGLAEGLQTAVPSRVVVDGTVNAAVHEVGHYGAGHTRLAALTDRGRDFVVAMAQGTGGPVGWLVRLLAWSYLAVAAASNRDQEHEADAYSARVAGPATAARALRAVVAADAAWNVLTDEYGGVVQDEHGRAPLSTGVQALLDARRDSFGAAVDQVLAERRTSTSDSHPPIGVRVERFERQAAVGAPGAEHRAQADADVHTSVLGAAVGHALTTQAGARVRFSWEPGWDEPFSMVLPDGRQVRFEDAVRPVTERPDQVPALREWLRGKGVDLANETRAIAEPEPQARAAWIMVHEGATKELSVVLCDTGLLLVRVPEGGLGRKALRNLAGRRAREEAERVGALRDGGVGAARQDKLCTWIDTDDLVAARLRPALNGWRLDVRTSDGTTRRIQSGQHTVELGEPGYALGALLGVRLGEDAWKAAAR